MVGKASRSGDGRQLVGGQGRFRTRAAEELILGPNKMIVFVALPKLHTGALQKHAGDRCREARSSVFFRWHVSTT
jgi:hypothetical protein